MSSLWVSTTLGRYLTGITNNHHPLKIDVWGVSLPIIVPLLRCVVSITIANLIEMGRCMVGIML